MLLKDTIKNMKKETTEKKKLLTTYVSDKRFIYRTYIKQLLQLKEKTKTPTKMEKYLSRHFTIEVIGMAKWHMKR